MVESRDRIGPGDPSERALPPAARLGRSAIAISAVAASLACASTLRWRPRPLLLWNSSPSSPLGLYRVGPPDRLRTGDYVVGWPPRTARALAASRLYLPAGVPLVKRVAAVAGDRVCASGESIFINARKAVERRPRDRLGRPIPWWSGCRVLRAGELFLLAPRSAEGFDGRYFGISRRGEIIGRARLIWTKPAGGPANG